MTIGRGLACSACAAILLLAATGAYAADGEPSVYSEGRKYVGAQGSAVVQALSSDKIGSGTRKGEIQGVSSSGAGGGASLLVGIRSNGWVAWETQLDFLVGPKLSGLLVRDDQPDEVREDESYNMYNGWFQAKLYPFHWLLDQRMDGRFQPYVKAGGGLMITTGLGTKTPIAFAGKVGGGADLHMGENWSLGFDAAYLIPSNNLANLNSVVLGINATYYWY